MQASSTRILWGGSYCLFLIFSKSMLCFLKILCCFNYSNVKRSRGRLLRQLKMKSLASGETDGGKTKAPRKMRLYNSVRP